MPLRLRQLPPSDADREWVARSRAYDALASGTPGRERRKPPPAMASSVRLAEDVRTQLREMPPTAAETAPLSFPTAAPVGVQGSVPEFRQASPGIGPLSRLDTSAPRPAAPEFPSAAPAQRDATRFHEVPGGMPSPTADMPRLARERDASSRQPEWRGQATVAAGDAVSRVEGQANVAAPADRAGSVPAQPAVSKNSQAGQASNHMTLSGTLTLQADGTGKLEGTAAGTVPRP